MKSTINKKPKKLSYSDFCTILTNMNTEYTEKISIIQDELNELKELVLMHDIALYKPLKHNKKSFTDFLNRP